MQPDTTASEPTVPERSWTMRTVRASLVAAAAVTLGGCNLDLTNPNQPTVASTLSNPRASISRMVVGVLATYRDNRAAQIRALGSFGRETYYMFITDGRFITGPYRDWKQNNSFEAGTQWGARYQNYRNAYAAMQLINSSPTSVSPTTLTAPEKAGALGVLKTFIALDMLHVIEARGPIGAVVDMTDDVNAVNPIVSEDSVYKWISAKLDEAQADLVADTMSAFYFPMHTGFSAFGVAANKPAGFGQFNRAIKARVEAKRGSLGCGAPCYTAALTALGATWIANLDGTNRDNGVYVIYSTSGVAQDDRYRRKVALSTSACSTNYTSPQTEVSVTATYRACTYATNVTPTPIIRNEELVLLRAEAEWFTVATAAALTDLAAVRAGSGATRGGTAVVKFATPAVDSEFVAEVLLQRTLSLYQEAHRFPDYRRFGKLAALATLAQDVAQGFSVAAFTVHTYQECDARARVGNPGGIPRSCPGGPP